MHRAVVVRTAGLDDLNCVLQMRGYEIRGAEGHDSVHKHEPIAAAVAAPERTARHMGRQRMAENKFKSMADILAAQPLFMGLDPEITDLLAGCATNAHFQADAYLLKADAPADTFYLVRSGDVAVELRMPGRGRLTVQTVHPGHIVGASWFLPPYRWRFDARAVDTVRATGIDAACLRSKCDADPRIGYQVMQRFLPVVAERLQSARLRLVDLYAPPNEVGRAL